MEELEKKIGYVFKDKNLLKQALTHSSITADLSKNYERLEFLGDRVAGVAIASMLYDAFPNEPEGNLSQRFMALVCKETMAEMARRWELEKFIHAESIDVVNNDNVLCDAIEAIIGAVYVDAGSEAAVRFVHHKWHLLINTHTEPPKDSKTRLQEVAHEKNLPAPIYSELSKTGTEHEPIYCMQVSIEGLEPQSGVGRNKKLAEQLAAHKMLVKLGVKNG